MTHGTASLGGGTPTTQRSAGSMTADPSERFRRSLLLWEHVMAIVEGPSLPILGPDYERLQDHLSALRSLRNALIPC